MSEKDKESPRVFSVVKHEKKGWQFSRRDFITLAGAATAGAALACGKSSDDTPEVEETAVFGASVEGGGGASVIPATIAVTPPTGDELAGRLEACASVKAHEGEMYNAMFSPDGTLMATFSADNTPKLWSIPGGEMLMKAVPDQTFTFNPFGETFFKKDYYSVEIYTIADMALKATCEGEFFEQRPPAFTYDGKQFAVKNYSEIIVFSCPDGAEIRRFAGLSDPTSLSFSPDGSMLAAADSMGLVMLWSWPDGEELMADSSAFLKVSCVAFTPDSKYLVVTTDYGPTFIYSGPDGEKVGEFTANEGITWYGGFFGEGNTFGAFGDPSVFNLYSIPDAELLKTYNLSDFRWPDFSDKALLHFSADTGNIEVISFTDLETYASVPFSDAQITTASVSRDLKQLAVADWSFGVHLFSLPDGQETGLLDASVGMVKFTCFSPDGSLLIVGDNDGKVSFYTTPGGEFYTCLVDIEAVPYEVEVNQYHITTTTGETVTYTLPCGSSIPAGAVCTCNCVAGSGCSCVGHVSCSCVGDVCSCVSHVSGGGSHYWFPN